MEFINYNIFKRVKKKGGRQSDSRMISNHTIISPLGAYAEDGVKNKKINLVKIFFSKCKVIAGFKSTLVFCNQKDQL